MAPAAMDVDLVDDLDCDVYDFDVMEALGLDLSSAADEQVGDHDCSIFDFDVIEAFDLDLSSADDNLVDDLDFVIVDALDLELSSADDNKFCGGSVCYSAIFSGAETVSHCRHVCEHDNGDGDNGAAATCAWLMARLGDYNDGCDGAEEESGTSSSPADSGVTDDGSFLAPSPEDEGAAEVMSAYMAELERSLFADDHDEQAELDQGILGVVLDYFAGDDQLLVITAEVVSAMSHGEPTGDVEEEENDVVLAAREHEQSASRKRARYE